MTHYNSVDNRRVTHRAGYSIFGALLLAGLALLPLAGEARAQRNSLPALMEAMTKLSANENVLNIPEGTYVVSSTWEVTRPGVTIKGAGIGKTIFVRDAGFAGNPLIKMNAENSTISNLTLDGNGMEVPLSLKANGAVADSVEVKNFRHIGIVVPGSGCRVTRCVITGYGNPEIRSIGIWHDSGPNAADSSIMIDHNTISDNGINGVFCTGGKVDVIANQFSGNHRQIVPVGGGQVCIGNNGRAANTVATISDNTIVDGGGPKSSGIETAGGSYTITNNTVRNHGMAGIVIGVNATRAVVSGNVISNSGRNTDDRNRPQVRAAIYVLYGAQNVRITNNRCFDDQRNKTQTYGVLLVPPTRRMRMRFPARATEHIVVANNDFRGNLHPEGVLDASGARDRVFARNLSDR